MTIQESMTMREFANNTLNLIHNGKLVYFLLWELSLLFKKIGEQKNRNYKWYVSPNKHVFGLSGEKVINEAKMCLQPEIAGDM